ncbi:Tryptophan synthase alpha chain [hydrothermal vent metagenome]|uniref:tryptophan synthase n=1 Tax=hydrothermal vent metagenome TaxID=652676 RepID=A0A3B1CCK4_9ZZZZ
MSRLAACFEKLGKAGRKALVPYVTAGDPEPGVTVSLMHAMVAAGANILELGVPFSDPMAEGPVIQRAMERALEHDVSLDDVLEMVKIFRQTDADTPVVLMGYLNPVEVKGYTDFAREAQAAGIDAVLLVDMPPEEADDLLSALYAHELDMIFLVAPTTDEARIRMITESGRGFIYYVSLKGVTGAGHLDISGVKQHLANIRAQTALPVAVGFGIKDAESAASIAGVADAVVVGSALVRKIEENLDSSDKINSAVAGLLLEMRAAMDAG